MNEAKKIEQNAVKVVLHNMSLDKEFSNVYSDVDGLSLQNLFAIFLLPLQAELYNCDYEYQRKNRILAQPSG